MALKAAEQGNPLRRLNYTLRLRRAELDVLRRAASKENVRLSEFVRRVLVDAAQRRLARQ